MPCFVTTRQCFFDKRSSKLQGYSGFDPTLCFGDILLSYVWESSYPNRHLTGDLGKKESTEAAKTQPTLSEEMTNKKMHDFIRTHFHRATHCDFCTKKDLAKGCGTV